MPDIIELLNIIEWNSWRSFAIATVYFVATQIQIFILHGRIRELEGQE